MIKELAPHVDTDFALLVQWDGFVVNADAWSDDFLDYDYIGAKWIFHTDGHNVGNGGFSLRSRRLLEALRDPHVVPGAVEDDAICRTYRTYLEATHGIRFAPEAVADRFSFEASYWTSPPFGFHGLFNFWMFLDRAGLAAFLSMATPRILGSVQCLRLAKNYVDLKRNDEALMVLRRIVEAHPGGEAAQMLATLEAAAVAGAGRRATRPARAAAASATRSATASRRDTDAALPRHVRYILRRSRSAPIDASISASIASANSPSVGIATMPAARAAARVARTALVDDRSVRRDVVVADPAVGDAERHRVARDVRARHAGTSAARGCPAPARISSTASRPAAPGCTRSGS